MKKKKEFNLNGYIFASLRKVWRWWPERRKVYKESEVVANGKVAYVCYKCEDVFNKKEVQVDHIDPVINPDTGFVSWDEYVARLFVKAECLQVLCKPCHKEKSKSENKRRRRKK